MNRTLSRRTSRPASRTLGLLLGVALAASAVTPTQASWLSRIMPGRYSSGPAVATVRIDGATYRLSAMTANESGVSFHIVDGIPIPNATTDSARATRISIRMSRLDGPDTLPQNITPESIELMQGGHVVLQSALLKVSSPSVNFIMFPPDSYVGRGVRLPATGPYTARVSIRTPNGVIKVLVAAPAEPTGTTVARRF